MTPPDPRVYVVGALQELYTEIAVHASHLSGEAQVAVLEVAGLVHTRIANYQNALIPWAGDSYPEVNPFDRPIDR